MYGPCYGLSYSFFIEISKWNRNARLANFAYGVLQSAWFKTDKNHRALPPDDDEPDDKPDDKGPDDPTIPQIVKLRGVSDDASLRSATLRPEELLGRTFLMPRRSDGQRFRAKIVGYEGGELYHDECMNEFFDNLEKERQWFRVEVGDPLWGVVGPLLMIDVVLCEELRSFVSGTLSVRLNCI